MTKSICANRGKRPITVVFCSFCVHELLFAENCVTCEVLILFNDTRNNFAARSPRQLYNVLRKTNRRFSKLLDGKMQDAHEFLKLLAEQMETEAHPLKWLDAFFVTDIRVSIKCSTCGNVYETTGLLGDVTLDVGHKSIQTALNTYFAWESVNDYDCQCCKRKVAAKKRISLISSPSCLCITLKRFSENRRKINRKIQIDLGLSTNGYFDAGPTNSGDCKYKLTSVINHVGQNMYSGHYTATICSPDTAFYEFDDTTVRVLNGNGVKENDAYILFYECTKVTYNATHSYKYMAIAKLHTLVSGLVQQNVRITRLIYQHILVYDVCYEICNFC